MPVNKILKKRGKGVCAYGGGATGKKISNSSELHKIAMNEFTISGRLDFASVFNTLT